MQVDIFEKVRNGEIVSTDQYQVKSIQVGTDDGQKYKIYTDLLSMLSKGYITGVPIDKGDLGPNFDQLQVTKLGSETYDFLITPMNQIGKPTLWETCLNAIVGFFVGRISWFFFVTVICILIPTLNEDAEELLRRCIDWLLTLIA
ncbi:hypothetical protein ACFFLZ_14825 [Photobacterium aphoticum]|uniref:Uncharacterized protein n=1 Tax=Photobacterium aphoticum TaxID=754436 RepID=A0A0J1GKK8_9GAMM|nr:hypothetical protein [Photobacterium aphoticum]KLV00240.1 hypothetical protein ABT58_14770 [Photobacterium aphoticum]PSU56608.1 hypothetical protein C9I90_12475 [Photobacterium aphoticum]GHA55818.1 hypothetical protein GCM10007086_32280 [Photobacterium aphoticum]